jgi:hypothetical protein
VLASTFTALRTQGLPTQPLRLAAVSSFVLRTHPGTSVLGRGGSVFWTELVSSRRAYRNKTGHNIEDMIAGPDRV